MTSPRAIVRKLRVTFDYQNSATQQSVLFEVLQRRGEDWVVADSYRPPLAHYKRILQHRLGKYRIGLDSVERLNLNDGRSNPPESPKNPYDWAEA